MDSFHKLLMKLACHVAGDKEVELFTLHKALLPLLGYDWWDPPGYTIQWVLKRVVHPTSYFLLLVLVSILTCHNCFYLDTSKSLEFFIFMNNIICVFTFMFAALKTLYMRFSYGKEAKHLIILLTAVGEFKTDATGWENSLKAFCYYFGLLTAIIGFWASIFLLSYGCLPYQTSYPWDQTTSIGWLAAFLLSFMTATYCGLIHSSVDTIISVSCGVIISHLATLKEYLRGVGLPGNKDSETLIIAIQLHEKLIQACKKMNDCFNLLFACQSLYTVLHACVIIFTFVKAEDLLGAIGATMPMLIAAYAQLFMYCYFGQWLTSSFDELTFASYDNFWYKSNIIVQKGLLMLSRQSQKMEAVHGLGSAKASFASYLSSFQESISYYLILKTLTSNED